MVFVRTRYRRAVLDPLRRQGRDILVSSEAELLNAIGKVAREVSPARIVISDDFTVKNTVRIPAAARGTTFAAAGGATLFVASGVDPVFQLDGYVSDVRFVGLTVGTNSVTDEGSPGQLSSVMVKQGVAGDDGEGGTSASRRVVIDGCYLTGEQIADCSIAQAGSSDRWIIRDNVVATTNATTKSYVVNVFSAKVSNNVFDMDDGDNVLIKAGMVTNNWFSGSFGAGQITVPAGGANVVIEGNVNPGDITTSASAGNNVIDGNSSTGTITSAGSDAVGDNT